MLGDILINNQIAFASVFDIVEDLKAMLPYIFQEFILETKLQNLLIYLSDNPPDFSSEDSPKIPWTPKWRWYLSDSFPPPPIIPASDPMEEPSPKKSPLKKSKNQMASSKKISLIEKDEEWNEDIVRDLERTKRISTPSTPLSVYFPYYSPCIIFHMN